MFLKAIKPRPETETAEANEALREAEPGAGRRPFAQEESLEWEMEASALAASLCREVKGPWVLCSHCDKCGSLEATLPALAAQLRGGEAPKLTVRL